jgi:hypothetical protein
MWPSLMGPYSNLDLDFDCPEPHTKKVTPFGNHDPWSNPGKCRIGAYTKPRKKMTKHRKHIKKMKEVRKCVGFCHWN